MRRGRDNRRQNSRRGGYNNNNRSGGYRHGGGGGRRHGRNPTQASESGNKRERIAVESGFLVLIDQFMLANPEIVVRFRELLDADPAEKDAVINEYGGLVLEVEPGTYRIERDPFKFSIVIHPEEDSVEQDSIKDVATELVGNVFVDTRCLAMIDRELLDDLELLEKYQQLWFAGQDKACRDLLRDNGGAVRYGFNRFGDELGVYLIPGEPVIALWPDIDESTVSESEGEAASL